MNNGKVIDRIKKLLAMANDGKFDHEAEAALLLAQKIMVEHNITMSEIESVETVNKKAVHTRLTDYSGRTPWWKKDLSQIIADNFRCLSYISKIPGKTSILIIGLEEDAEIAREVYQYAVSYIEDYTKKYMARLRRQGRSTQGVRNDWIGGFLSGLQHKFREQVSENEWGLVLVRDAVVEDAISKMNFKKEQRSGIKPRFRGSQEARQDGYNKGQAFGGRNAKGITVKEIN